MDIPKNEPSTSFIIGVVLLMCAALFAAMTWPLYLSQKEDVDLVTIEGALTDASITYSKSKYGHSWSATLRIKGYPDKLWLNIHEWDAAAVNKPSAQVKTFRHAHSSDSFFAFGNNQVYGLWVDGKEVVSYAYSKSQARSEFMLAAGVILIFFGTAMSALWFGWVYMKAAKRLRR